MTSPSSTYLVKICKYGNKKSQPTEVSLIFYYISILVFFYEITTSSFMLSLTFKVGKIKRL